MTPLDDRLLQAVSDLRDDVDALDAPPFSPKRSAVPMMLALVLVLGVGIAAFAAWASSGETGGMSVATQPETVESPAIDLEPAEAEPEAVGEDSGAVESLDDFELVQASRPLVGQITNAQAGEFLMPLPAGIAWSPDESRLLMYRTGSVEPGHFIVDAASGAIEGAVPLSITPADIEQVYWHPNDTDLLVYTSDADVMVYDLAIGQSRVVASFDQCDRVDSGVGPVAPASDGTLSLLCHTGAGRSLLVYNLISGEVRQAPTSGDTAAEPSPTGSALVRWNGDGSASVLDRALAETGVTLDIDNNVFAFVTEGSGREWIATTLFDDPAIGTIVVLPLDGADPPVVVIGPDRGDPYPPSGTNISAAANVVAVSIQGRDDGALAGRIVVATLAGRLGGSFSEASLAPVDPMSFAHQSEGLHGYWSTPFLSVSPTGRFVAYSTDSGSDRIDTFVIALDESTG